MNAYVAKVRQNLFLQAAMSAFFLLLPDTGRSHGWAMLAIGIAGGCVFVAVYIGTGAPGGYEATLTWEVVAVLLGGYALTQGHYVYGSVVGIFVLIALLNSDAAAAFVAQPVQRPTQQTPTQQTPTQQTPTQQIPTQQTPTQQIPVQQTPTPYAALFPVAQPPAGSWPPPPPAWPPPPPAWPPQQR